MADAPSFREEYVSQIPVRLLKALGYTYLRCPPRRYARRSPRRGDPRWHPGAVACRAQRDHGQGLHDPFPEANLRSAPRDLPATRAALNGLIPTSQRVYELLTLGTTLTQTIDGDTKSYTLRYIDWQHPEHNVHRDRGKFSVEKRSPTRPAGPISSFSSTASRWSSSSANAPTSSPNRAGPSRRRSPRRCATSVQTRSPTSTPTPRS